MSHHVTSLFDIQAKLLFFPLPLWILILLSKGNCPKADLLALFLVHFSRMSWNFLEISGAVWNLMECNGIE